VWRACTQLARKERPSMIPFGMAIILSFAGIAILEYEITSTVN
jgi:hypothetical protein